MKGVEPEGPDPHSSRSPAEAPFLALFSDDRWLFGLAVAALVVIGRIGGLGLRTGHWRHDSFAYLKDSARENKLRGEGRWLTDLLVDGLRAVDARILWAGGLLLLFAGLYLLFDRITPDRWVAVHLAILCLLFPGNFAQAYWPLATFSGALVFLLSVVATRRFGWPVLPILGIATFATSTPYLWFLFPLCLVPEVEKRGTPIRGWAVPGLAWVGGFVLGALVAGALNGLRFGKPGIDLAEWRRPRPSLDFESFIANVGRSASSLGEQLPTWLPFGFSLLLLVALALPFVLGRTRPGPPGALVSRGILAVVIAVSSYAPVFVAGILTSYRSLLPLCVGLVVAPILLADRSLHRPIVLILAIAVGVPSARASLATVEWFSRITRTHVEQVEAVAPELPTQDRGIIVDARRHSDYLARLEAEIEGLPRKPPFLEGLHAPIRLAPGFRVAGIEITRFCPYSARRSDPPACREFLAWVDRQGPCPDHGAAICVLGSTRRRTVLRLEGNPSIGGPPATDSSTGNNPGRERVPDFAVEP